MKILLAAGLYPPDIGGPATYAKMLEAGLVQAGIAVVVVPYSLVRKVPKWRRHVAYMRLLWRNLEGCDGIYALDPISVGLPARLVAMLRLKTFMVRLGGDYAWEQGVQRFGLTETLDMYTNHRRQVSWRVRVLARLQTQVVKGAAAVVVPSAYLKKIVTTWGIAPEKINVIYSAHSVPTVTYNRSELRTTFGMSGLALVSIARLTPWKGMKTLIELVAMRQARGEVMSLYIGGDGPDREMLEAYAHQCGVATRVHFLGTLSFTEVCKLVTAGDIFLLDTAYEGLSHQLIEVMALGTPIITTPVGGNTELLTHEVDALFVPVGKVTAYDEAVTRLLTDEVLKNKLVDTAHARAEHFAKDEAIPKIVELLNKILVI